MILRQQLRCAIGRAEGIADPRAERGEAVLARTTRVVFSTMCRARDLPALAEGGPQVERLLVTGAGGADVGAAVVDALADLDLAYPKVGEDKLKELATAKSKLLKR